MQHYYASDFYHAGFPSGASMDTTAPTPVSPIPADLAALQATSTNLGLRLAKLIADLKAAGVPVS